MTKNIKKLRSNYHHYTFSPKYRRAVLGNPDVKVTVTETIRHICNLKGIEIFALAIEADHIHILCALPKTMSPAKGAFLIKWYSSIHTRRLCPHLKDIVHKNHLWQHNYYSGTVGSKHRLVKRYILNQ